MRRLPAYVLAGFLLPAATLAQTAAAPPAAAGAAQADPVIASVNGHKIYFSDIQQAAQNASPQMQQLPSDQLFQLLVDEEITREALLIDAHKQDLQANPQVATAMQQAANEKLEDAYVQLAVAKQVTPAAIQTAYAKQYAGKPGPEQVDARQILVRSQAEAQQIIDQLNAGANFATLAQKYSIDPGAKDGGELGWFSQDEMVPEFANAAFALKPGQYTKTPVQSQFGWHVILCEGRRVAPTPALADVQQQITKQLEDAALKSTLAAAKAKVKIVIYSADGTAGPQSAPAP